LLKVEKESTESQHDAKRALMLFGFVGTLIIPTNNIRNALRKRKKKLHPTKNLFEV
jgi:hypothetical protein